MIILSGCLSKYKTKRLNKSVSTSPSNLTDIPKIYSPSVLHRSNKKRMSIFNSSFFVTCTPSGTRTLDPLIKSQLLYQLS